MHPCNTWLITVLVLVRDLILLFCDEHIHDVWKSVRSSCWLWLDHTVNSFLDSKPGDAATGMVFCQTSKAWKNTVMDVLCLNLETWAWVRRACTASETHCLLELGDKGGISLFSPSAIDFLIWYSVALQSQLMFGDQCAQPNFLFKISCQIRVNLSLPKTMLLSERWTLKYWDRTECVLCPFPALIFTGKVQESTTCHRRVLPTWCSACHQLPGLNKGNSTEGKVYRCFRFWYLLQNSL